MIAVRLPIMMCQTQMTLVAVVIHTARVILAMSVLFVVVSRMTLLKKTKRLHDVVRTNGCGVTTAGFSGNNTPLVG